MLTQLESETRKDFMLRVASEHRDVTADNGRRDMYRHSPGPWEKMPDSDAIMSGEKVVARMKYSDHGELESDVKGLEYTANVALIQHAPDMLEALRVCHDILLMDPKRHGGRAHTMVTKILDKVGVLI